MDFFSVFNLTTDAITIALMSLTNQDVQNREVCLNNENIRGKIKSFYTFEESEWLLTCLFPMGRAMFRPFPKHNCEKIKVLLLLYYSN